MGESKFVAEEKPIVSIPAVVVAKPVDVRVPIALIAIDVANRDTSCAAPSVTQANATTSRVFFRLNRIWGREPTSATHQRYITFFRMYNPEPRHLKS